VWRPRALGSVIAERALTLERPGRRSTVVRVKFGRPVRAPRPQRGDPWWCPVQISGLGRRQLEKVPGEDSLQALTLALEFVSRALPLDADRASPPPRTRSAHLQWLGERESLVFANTFTAGLLTRSLQNCMTGLADAVDVLENGGAGAAARTMARRLRALVVSGGYTADPRRVLPVDAPLERPGFFGRATRIR
jgi:hypothetical protein